MSKCSYCGSSMKGRGCPFSSNGIHYHIGGTGCAYCGSAMRGIGCPYSPDGKHFHGVGESQPQNNVSHKEEVKEQPKHYEHKEEVRQKSHYQQPEYDDCEEDDEPKEENEPGTLFLPNGFLLDSTELANNIYKSQETFRLEQAIGSVPYGEKETEEEVVEDVEEKEAEEPKFKWYSCASMQIIYTVVIIALLLKGLWYICTHPQAAVFLLVLGVPAAIALVVGGFIIYGIVMFIVLVVSDIMEFFKSFKH